MKKASISTLVALGFALSVATPAGAERAYPETIAKDNLVECGRKYEKCRRDGGDKDQCQKKRKQCLKK